MKTKVHAAAGAIALLTILIFWTSTVFAELFGTAETVAMVKALILKGMFILIPAMMILGGSGMRLGGQRQDKLTLGKKRRMPIIAGTGILVLLPAAFFLDMKAAQGAFDTWFYVVQAIELVAGASNIRLMLFNFRDGLKLTGKIAPQPTNAGTEVANACISVLPNGPLLLSGASHVTTSDGASLETKDKMPLCRCGASKNKPYCDGSHTAINFDDAVSDERTVDKVFVYKGEYIHVHYNRLLCSHAAECGKHLKPVFDSSRKPWILPDEGTVAEIKIVVEKCPSGALSYSLPDAEPQHIVSGGQSMHIEKNGPYHINGIPLIDGALAKGACGEKYVLCRCGASKNKPFCDGSHIDVKWKDE